MNNSTCFTETTTICLVWQIIFIILNCLTDSVLQLYLSINMFSFQDLPHLQEKYLSLILISVSKQCHLQFLQHVCEVTPLPFPQQDLQVPAEMAAHFLSS